MLAWASAVLLPSAQGALIPKTQVPAGDYYGKQIAFYDAVVDQCYYMKIGSTFVQRLPIPPRRGLQLRQSGAIAEGKGGENCTIKHFDAAPPPGTKDDTMAFSYVESEGMVAMYTGDGVGTFDGKCDSVTSTVEYFTFPSSEFSLKGVALYSLQDKAKCNYDVEVYFPEDYFGPDVVVHGDPMFKANGTGTHLWVAAGRLTPLLTWEAAEGKMQLLGKTVSRPSSGNQWFNQFVVQKDGKDVLDVSVNQTAAMMDVICDERVVNQWTEARPKTKGLEIKAVNMFSHEIANVTERPRKEALHFNAGGLSMSVYPSVAQKFEDSFSQQKYQHLNVRFGGGLPASSSGMFAEVCFCPADDLHCPSHPLCSTLPTLTAPIRSLMTVVLCLSSCLAACWPEASVAGYPRARCRGV